MSPYYTRFRAVSAAMLASGAARIRANRFGVECGILVVLASAAALAVGTSALSAADRYDQETRRLGRTAAAVDAWLDDIQRPLPAESASWRESDDAVLTIASEPAGPTSIARFVAVRAEEAGIADLGMRLLSPDSVASPPAATVGDWTVRSGESAVAVDFAGDWSSVIAFLGSLPPQVEVGGVQVDPGPDFLLRARVVLLAREVSRAP